MEFKLPELGENIESGDVINVLVHEGDTIQAQQGVVEIETDKAVVEVPAPQAGRVTKVHVKKGDKVPVGAPLLTLEPAGESAPAAGSKAEATPAPAPEKPAPEAKSNGRKAETAPPAKRQPAEAAPASEAPKREAAAAKAPPPAQRPAPSPQRPAPARPSRPEAAPAAAPNPPAGDDFERAPTPAGPATRRLARELGVELEHIPGTGPSGRITREDVVNAVREANLQSTSVQAAPSADAAAEKAPLPGVASRDAWGPIRRAPLTKIRKTIAANMARSAATIPHVTNFDDADITELERIRKGSMADYVDKSVKLTLLPFVMKAVALSLKSQAGINASLDMESGEIVYKDYVNIGVAVDTERGLIVPVVRDVDRLSIPQIAQAVAKVTAQARDSQFTIDDLRGGTFTISNLGAIGGTYSTPIINYPEVAILLLGRSRKLPVVTEGDKLEVRLMAPLSLSYDHRWVDGAAAARFLNDVKSYLEAPARLLLAP